MASDPIQERILSIPVSPTDLLIVEESFDFVFLSWQDMSMNEDYFVIDRAGEDSIFSFKDNINKNEEDYLDYTVSQNSVYYYRVKAVNSEGSSEYSNVVKAYTKELPNKAPSAPSDLIFSNISTESIQLSWKSTSDNQEGFILFRSSNSNDFFPLDSINRLMQTYTDNDLKSGFSYRYFVQAYNKYGNSTSSDTVTTFLPLSIDAEIVGIAINAIDLRWTKIDLIGDAIHIERSSDNMNDFVLIGKVSSRDSIYRDTTVTQDMNYQYKVILMKGNRIVGVSDVLNASTFFKEIKNRIKEGLIAEYHFEKTDGEFIPDLSGVNPLLNLEFDNSSIDWNDKSKLRLRGGIGLRSLSDASKILESTANSNQMSIELWIKTDSLLSDTSCIIVLGADNVSFFELSIIPTYTFPDDEYSYQLTLNNNRIKFISHPEYTWKNIVLHHIVYTIDSLRVLRLHINNDLIFEQKEPLGTVEFPMNDPRLFIGNSLQYTKPWIGTCYLTAFYNKALKPDEISQNYFAGPDSDSVTYTNSPLFELNAFPNVTNGEISVIVKPNGTGYEFMQKPSLKIFNLSGYLISDIIVFDPSEETVLNFNLSSYPSGIYLISLYLQGEPLVVRRVFLIK